MILIKLLALTLITEFLRNKYVYANSVYYFKSFQISNAFRLSQNVHYFFFNYDVPQVS